MINMYDYWSGTSFKTRTHENRLQYYDRKKFESGMTGEIIFEVYYGSSPGMVVVYPSFVIYHKRHQAWSSGPNLTGQDGLKPLVWANRRIQDFSDYLFFNKPLVQCITIHVTWDYGDRGRAYKKALQKEGFYLSYDEGFSSMKKIIQRPIELV